MLIIWVDFLEELLRKRNRKKSFHVDMFCKTGKGQIFKVCRLYAGEKLSASKSPF